MGRAHDALRIDQRNRPKGKSAFGIENAQTLADFAVWIEIGQERITDAAHALRPDFECRQRIARKTEQLRTFITKLLQRTVEVRGLVASSTCESERVGGNDRPLGSMKLAQRNFSAVMGLELEIRDGLADVCHLILL